MFNSKKLAILVVLLMIAPIVLAACGAAPEPEVIVETVVETVEEALAGARDIIAEWVNEDQQARKKLRRLYFSRAIIHSRVSHGKEVSGAKYRDYFDWQEPALTAPSHRILAMRRGEKEDLSNLSIGPPEAEAIGLLKT